MLVATASWFNNPAVALPTRSTMSGRRNTASSRVRRYGKSPSTAVSARICSWCYLFRHSQEATCNQHFALDISRSASPRQRRVANLRIIVGRFSSPRDLVCRRRPRRVALDRKIHLPGRCDNLTPALRPVRDQRRRFLPGAFSEDGEKPAMRVNSLSLPYCSMRMPSRSRRFHAKALR